MSNWRLPQLGFCPIVKTSLMRCQKNWLSSSSLSLIDSSSHRCSCFGTSPCKLLCRSRTALCVRARSCPWPQSVPGRRGSVGSLEARRDSWRWLQCSRSCSAARSAPLGTSAHAGSSSAHGSSVQSFSAPARERIPWAWTLSTSGWSSTWRFWLHHAASALNPTLVVVQFHATHQAECVDRAS